MCADVEVVDPSCGGFDAGDHHEDGDPEPLTPPMFATDDTGRSLRVLDLIEPSSRSIVVLHDELVAAIDVVERARWQAHAARQLHRDVLEELERLADTDRDAAERVVRERARLEERARAGYVAGPEQRAAALLSSRPAGHPAHSAVYLDVAAADGAAVVRRWREVRREVSDASRRAADRLAAAETEVIAAEKHLEAAVAARETARWGVGAAGVRHAVLTADPNAKLAFPVAGNSWSFVNDWGNCRGAGCARGHQGTDIMAPLGAPAVAMEGGTIARKGHNTLGGWKLWLVGDSGTEYYYAHFDAFAHGIENGARVEMGQVLGAVGNTGAPWAPPHLHLQVHPGGGAAVNPYPLLVAVGGGQRAAAAP